MEMIQQGMILHAPAPHNRTRQGVPPVDFEALSWCGRWFNGQLIDVDLSDVSSPKHQLHVCATCMEHLAEDAATEIIALIRKAHTRTPK